MIKMRKKKLLLLIASLLLSNLINAAEEKEEKVIMNYELKVGITPYEKYGGKAYSERFNDGVDFGLEAYRRFSNKYVLGFGGEVKRKLNSEYIKADGERLYSYYIIGKKNLTDTVSLVGRLGKTSQREFDSKYYVAAGLEKRFGRVTFQVLGENTKLQNSLDSKNYTTVGLKLGYIFGEIPEGNKILEAPVDPVPERIVPEPVETPKFKLEIIGDEVTGGYQAYKVEVPEPQIENVRMMTKQLNEYDRSGTLEMTAYSDNTGSKELNVRLANERMDNLEAEFKNSGLTEKVRIDRKDPNMTVKEVYKVNNDTFDNRRINRRIEVNFIEDGVENKGEVENVRQTKENI